MTSDPIPEIYALKWSYSTKKEPAAGIPGRDEVSGQATDAVARIRRCPVPTKIEPPMPVLPRALDLHGELTAIRRDIHAHPELAFAEQRTSDLVAARLAEFGCEVYRGLAGTGVIGTI